MLKSIQATTIYPISNLNQVTSIYISLTLKTLMKLRLTFYMLQIITFLITHQSFNLYAY